MKKKRSQGFTLVEVIVVVVILAILAAILVPSMIGWIKKAEEKTAVVGCRTCVLAAQTLLSEKYRPGETPVLDAQAVLDLAQVDGSVSNIGIDTDSGTIAHLLYTDAGGAQIFYCRQAGADGCGNRDVYDLRQGAVKSDMGTALQSVVQGFNTATSAGFAGVEGGKPFSATAIDGVNAKTEGTFAHAIYQSLPAGQRAALDEVSWSIVKTTAGYRIYLTEVRYGADESADNIKVYKYDMATGQYQYTTTGKVTNGKVTAAGQQWSDWSDTMD